MIKRVYTKNKKKMIANAYHHLMASIETLGRWKEGDDLNELGEAYFVARGTLPYLKRAALKDPVLRKSVRGLEKTVDRLFFSRAERK